MISIIGMIIGALIFGASIYFLMKEKQDPESRKIYSAVACISVVVFVVALLSMIL